MLFLIEIPAYLFFDAYLNSCLCLSYYRNVNAPSNENRNSAQGTVH